MLWSSSALFMNMDWILTKNDWKETSGGVLEKRPTNINGQC